MHEKLVRIAGRTAVACAMVTLGLGGTQAALAGSGPGVVQVPCSATALASDISNASSGETLDLAKFCTYKLTAALPGIDDLDLTIQGNQSTIERSFAHGTPDFGIFRVTHDGDLVLNQVNVRNGDANVVDVGPIIRAVRAIFDNPSMEPKKAAPSTSMTRWWSRTATSPRTARAMTAAPSTSRMASRR